MIISPFIYLPDNIFIDHAMSLAVFQGLHCAPWCVRGSFIKLQQLTDGEIYLCVTQSI